MRSSLHSASSCCCTKKLFTSYHITIMLVKTKGIVLHHIKTASDSVLAKILTPGHGLLTLSLPKQGRGTKRQRQTLHHPLAMVGIEIEIKENREIHKLSAIELISPSHAIQLDPVKMALAMFCAEVLMKSIRHVSHDTPLFEFAEKAAQLLELSNEGVPNFHLFFLSRLTIYLGFYPQEAEEESESLFFDMNEGRFYSRRPPFAQVKSGQPVLLLKRLMQTGFSSMEQLQLNRTERNELLDLLLEYYALHLRPFPELKSVDVLRELFV